MSISSIIANPTNTPTPSLATSSGPAIIEFHPAPSGYYNTGCGDHAYAVPHGVVTYCCENGVSHILSPFGANEHPKCSNGEGGKNFLSVGDVLCTTEVEFNEDGLKTSFKAYRLIDETPPLLSDVVKGLI